eukprot:35774_1
MSSDKQLNQSEQKDSNKDYRTSVLRHCYRRIPDPNVNTSIFTAIFDPQSQSELPEQITEDMFVAKLRPLLNNLTLFDLHRKLATATYRSLSTPQSEQKSSDKLFGASDEKYASSLRFDLSPESIQSLTNAIKSETLGIMDRIAQLPDNERTTKNVLLPLIQLDQRMSGIENCVGFLQNVSPIKEVRDASNEAEVELRKFSVEISMRKDVYNVIKSYAANKEVTASLDSEQRRYLSFALRDYRRSGLDLEDEKYDRIKAIKKEMSTLSSAFSKNLNEENTKFMLAESELAGMSEDWKKARLITDKESDDVGKYDVSIKYPDLFPILRKCSVSGTREKMLRAHNTRCMEENTAIIEELVTLRYEHASILGKENHSQHVLEIRMAKDPTTVSDFLWDLNEKMAPLAAKDLEALLALKKSEMGASFDGVIHEHDFRYYCTVREEKEFAIDKESLREYFPLQTVIDGALSIYQKLLGLKFVRVPQNESQFAFWHDEVELYQVVDVSSEDLIGYFFVDLHPREGKYGHACMCSLQSGCAIYDDNGSRVGRQLPVNAMLCNFPKATPDKPSLLSHDDVVTFFHEFGHVMHQVCSQTVLDRFAGTSVERDFVEAPSQMLENWCWKATSLNLMSGHYENNDKIPNDLLIKLTKSKNANCGLLTKRQLYFGILDQTMHTATDAVDTQKLAQELQPKIMGIEAQKDTNFVASFGHLAGGYDAQYYGYMWSEVYSADMFATVFCVDGDESQLLNQDNGLKYRRKILQVGSSRDAADSLKDFLGREPNNRAFLKEKGLKI